MNPSSTSAAVPSEPTGPPELVGLRRLAANLRWTWHRPTETLLASIPGVEFTRHPLIELDQAMADHPDDLAAVAAARSAEIARAVAELDGMERPADRPVMAYFCPEFGIAAQLPQYSGGLGILAGDHLKASSDHALGLIGVGLFYREGFFLQDIVDGRQTERVEPVDPEAVGARATGLEVTVPVDGHEVVARVWQLWVGSTRLVLLDTDVASNPAWARGITDRLYAGDRRHRLNQELVLGLGGVQALRGLGLDVGGYHLNEGHACFLLLELLAERVAVGDDLDQATAWVRARSLFTTHTPVPAGIDRFDRAMVLPELEVLAPRIGVTADDLAGWATFPDDGPDRPFNTAALALHLCGRANGVSQLHASVSRRLFASLPAAERIEGITNGVHARTWVDPDLADLYDADLGTGWADGDQDAWSAVRGLDRERFAALRARRRRDLAALVEASTGHRLDPDRPIIGFARRFATYKRAALLLRDPDGLEATLAAGAQFVFAGKAHPADAEGKAVLAEIAAAGSSGPAAGGIVLVPGYDIGIAKVLYAGTDVWLNNPVRPHEACGTSGEKAALNGGLNCSISDGWWADWFLPGIGWEIPTVTPTGGAGDAAAAAPTEVGADDLDDEERDRLEARGLHRLLGDGVLPVVSDRGDAWWAMVTAMLGHLGPLVTAGRMVDEYNRRFYGPILDA
ncbi:MAG: alpha-glucan family phosphorylase [Acidimicrobiales bacterium]